MERTIGELASHPVISVEAETLVIEALKMMSARRISCIVVLLNAEPVGILTERDVVFAANWVIGQPTLRIREVMSKPVLMAPADMSLTEAYRLFRENRIRHLVVLGEQLELSGIFTQTDLIRAFHDTFFADDHDVSLLMSNQVRQVSPATAARQALSMMASHAISGVVVVDQQKPVGCFTERDAVRLVAGGVDIANQPVGTVMSTPVVTIPATASPMRALDLMRDHNVRRLVVLDEQGTLAGILTQTDLSRILDQHADDLGNRLTAPAGLFTHNTGLSMH